MPASSAKVVDLVLIPWALAIAASDVWRLRVPNVLLMLITVPALLVLAVNGRGLLGVSAGSSAIGLLLSGGLLLPGYLMGQVGAGDVKYAAVLGLLVGAPGIFSVLLWSALGMGVLSLAAWLAGSRYRSALTRKVPAALALSAGFIAHLAGEAGI